VKRVVHEHRGRIAIVSEPGRGTCVRVELPLAEHTP
jgi:signal transduction histidine kinase